MPRMYPLSLFPDLLAFHQALFRGHPYEPKVRHVGSPSKNEEKDRKDWHSYYGNCVEYITSLHNQFIAVLSIQGALAIGTLAAIPIVTGKGSLAVFLASSVAFTELALMVVATKLFRQHCVICWMLRRVEQEELGLPPWAGMKGLLGTAGNRLFTSPLVYMLSIVYGVFLALGLGIIIGLRGF